MQIGKERSIVPKRPLPLYLPNLIAGKVDGVVTISGDKDQAIGAWGSTKSSSVAYDATRAQHGDYQPQVLLDNEFGGIHHVGGVKTSAELLDLPDLNSSSDQVFVLRSALKDLGQEGVPVTRHGIAPRA